jgi:hypothetical protein
VVSAIALVTALAIDSRFSHDEAQPSGTPAREAAPPNSTPNGAAPGAATAPTSAAPAPAGVANAPARAEAAERRGETGAGPAPWKGEVAAFGAIGTGIGPTAAFGGRAIAGLLWPSGADLRIGADYLVMPEARVPFYDGVSLAMYELSGRASGCPLALSIGPSVRLSPCAGIASGIVHAETRRSPGVKTPGSANPAFVALFAEARVDAHFGAFFVEASGEVRFVVDPPTFALFPPDDQQALASMSAVAAFASLGMGLLL